MTIYKFGTLSQNPVWFISFDKILFYARPDQHLFYLRSIVHKKECGQLFPSLSDFYCTMTVHFQASEWRVVMNFYLPILIFGEAGALVNTSMLKKYRK